MPETTSVACSNSMGPMSDSYWATSSRANRSLKYTFVAAAGGPSTRRTTMMLASR